MTHVLMTCSGVIPFVESFDWDIGLALVPETSFHACTHYNKFMQRGNCRGLLEHSSLHTNCRK